MDNHTEGIRAPSECASQTPQVFSALIVSVGRNSHPPLAGGGQVNAPVRSTLQESHFSSNIAHNEFL